MAHVSYTSYKYSTLATVVSLISQIFMLGGIAMAVFGLMDLEFSMIGGGLLMAAVCGIGGHILAETINSIFGNAKWWRTVIKKQGLEDRIPHSVDLCFQVYNANPCNWTLDKISLLNPAGAAQIRQALASQNTI